MTTSLILQNFGPLDLPKLLRDYGHDKTNKFKYENNILHYVTAIPPC